MRISALRAAFAAFATVGLLAGPPPAFAADDWTAPPAPTVSNQEGGHGENDGHHVEASPQGEDQDAQKVGWMLAGIGGAAVLFGVFYLFKRRIGAFPANPIWVAPITIMRAGDSPDEGDFGPTEAHDHGATGHAAGH